MSGPVSIGRLHLLVHELIGHHNPHPSQATKLRASYPLRAELAQLQADLARLDRHHPQPLVVFGPVPPCPCNQHAILRADIARIDAALERVWTDTTAEGGLLDQVMNPEDRTLNGVQGDGEGGSGKPGSRPPVDLGGADLIRRVDAGVRAHEHHLRRELADLRPYGPMDWQQILWTLPVLASRLPAPELVDGLGPHKLLRDLHRDLNHWRSAALVVLGHIAPMVTLTTPCPHCGEQSMIVREDATSDVVCTTETCIDPTTRQASRWPRSAWEALLAGRYAAGTVNTEAAALHFGVTGATIRDWRRRGLISPAGGTERHPVYRLRDLQKAAAAPKARRPVPGPPLVAQEATA